MLRSFSVVLLGLASSSVVLAQPAAPTATVAAADSSAANNAGSLATPAPAPAPAPAANGLRNGFSLSAGQEFGGDRDVSGTMFGVDWRIGWRVTEPISVYLQSHLSFGSAHATGESGVTGTFAAAIMGEYMLPMRLFVAGGGGWGVLNNPNGPLAAVRAGYYPLETSAAGKARRLNVALDYRAYFADQGYGTVSQVSLSLGYDRF